MSIITNNSEADEEIIDNQEPIDPFVEPDRGKYENLLKNLQGGTIKNYGRNYSLYIFISFNKNKVNESKQWVRNKLADRITSTYAQLQQTEIYKQQVKEYLAAKQQDVNSSLEKPSGELCVNFFLSSNGYKALGFNNVDQKLTDAQFRRGMKKWYQVNISDEPPNDWEMGADDDIPVHGLVLLAHDHLSELEKAATQVIEEVEGDQIGDIIACEAGYVLTGQARSGNFKRPRFVVGPFGFSDNLSQPLFLKGDIDKYYDRQENIKGNESKEDKLKQGESSWDPFAPLKLVLLEDPFVKGEYGSYCVWQKLETDYQCFKDKEQELASKLGVETETAGALVMGRFKDGTPLELSPNSQSGYQNNNNFNYENDPNGVRCPLHSHIRQVNPRGDRDPENPNSPPPLSSQRNARIFRAGTTYFDDINTQLTSSQKSSQSYVSKLEHLRKVSKQKLEENVKEISGLLFVCFQRSITRQFSTLQISWSNDVGFPRQQSNKPKYLDPVIGYSTENQIISQEWPIEWNQEEKKDFSFQGCVKTKGGEFFFAPSISFLQNITDIKN